MNKQLSPCWSCTKISLGKKIELAQRWGNKQIFQIALPKQTQLFKDGSLEDFVAYDGKKANNTTTNNVDPCSLTSHLSERSSDVRSTSWPALYVNINTS